MRTMYPVALLTGMLALTSPLDATTYARAKEMAVFEHFEGTFRQESGPAEEGGIVVETEGAFYGHGNHFHLRK